MTRFKRTLDIDVYQMAKQRIKHIFDLYDTVVVAFSGGKDSLVCLHLVKEVQEELGIKGRVNVVFRDQELLQDQNIEFVDWYRRQPWIKMLWLCYPTLSHKYILGKKYPYVEWCPTRSAAQVGDGPFPEKCGLWMRPMPDWALSDPPPGWDYSGRGGKSDYDTAMQHFFPRGKICVITGVRAQESLRRFAACCVKLNENYLTATEAPRVMLGKPIYDWSENDVMYYLGANAIRWCEVYDMQYAAGQSLRVSAPVHSETAKRLDAVARVNPVFYDRLLQIFPEMDVQSRYYRDMVPYLRELIDEYASEGYPGIYRYIAEQVPEADQQALATKRVKVAEYAYNNHAPDAYNVRHVLNQIVSGQYRQAILPDGSYAKSKRGGKTQHEVS